MKYDAYIFDLDGTLLDTLDDLRDAVNHALLAFGFPEVSRERVAAALGNGSERLIACCLPGGRESPRFREVFDCYLARYLEHGSDKTRPYPGVTELLRELGDAGAVRAIVSNKPDSATQPLCERFFSGLVETSVGERPGVRRKPAPDSVLTVLSELGVTPERAVYIGDTEVDIETARAAGTDCVSVSFGFRTREELVESGATLIAADVAELRGALLG